MADVDSAYFNWLYRLVREAFPEAVVSPYLVIGGTDARHYAAVTDNAFRFTPVQINKAELQSIHAVNERLSFDNCARMVGFYIAYIQETSSIPGDADEAEEREIGSFEPAYLEESEELEDDLPIPTLQDTMTLQHGEEDAGDAVVDEDGVPEEAQPDDVGQDEAQPDEAEPED